MILAAGRGERMRPLTDTTPKPLLEVGGKPLIVWHIENLARAGIHELVINHAHLGHKIEGFLGNGKRYNVSIRYSPEAEALETAGGIANALPLLGRDPFLVINGDIFCDFDFTRLTGATTEPDSELACLVLVDNPLHHPGGDFFLDKNRIRSQGDPLLTFSGIGLYRAALFQDIPRGSPARLAPLLREAMDCGKVSGMRHDGRWIDVGTPQRLAQLDQELRNN